MNKNTGKLVFGKYKTYVSCYNTLTRKMKVLKAAAGITHNLTLYSLVNHSSNTAMTLGYHLVRLSTA